MTKPLQQPCPPSVNIHGSETWKPRAHSQLMRPLRAHQSNQGNVDVGNNTYYDYLQRYYYNFMNITTIL